MNTNTQHVLKLVLSAVCLALCLVLPFLTGQIPEIGSMLCPMHIPVLLCGLLCGPWWAAAVGAIAPILRSATLHMPPMFPTAVAMAFELAAYGLLAGLALRLLPCRKPWNVYAALLIAMVGGRIVWGLVSAVLHGIAHTEFGWSAFVAGAVTNAVPGIALHLLLIPVIVLALERALPWLKPSR